MVFHWSLSDSKSPQVSRTRLRILAVLSNAVVWIVFTRPPTSKSSGPFNLLLLLLFIRVFHINVSRWSFTWVWVTASLLKSPGLVSVFCPFSIKLSFGWSPLVRQFPSPPVPLIIIYLLYQKNQSQLVKYLPSCSIMFQFSCKVKVLILLFNFFQFTLWSAWTAKSTILKFLSFFFFCWLLFGLLLWPRLGSIRVYVCHF